MTETPSAPQPSNVDVKPVIRATASSSRSSVNVVIDLVSDDEVEEGEGISTNVSHKRTVRVDSDEIEFVQAIDKKLCVESNDDDDEVQFLTGRFEDTTVMPHQRESCTAHPFKVVSHVSNNSHCRFCYCYVCDIKASECELWTDNHCHAWVDNSRYRTEREIFTSPLLKPVSRLEVAAFWLRHHADIMALSRGCSVVTKRAVIERVVSLARDAVKPLQPVALLAEAAMLLTMLLRPSVELSAVMRLRLHRFVFDVVCAYAFTPALRRAFLLELDAARYPSPQQPVVHVSKLFPLDLVKVLLTFDETFAWVATRTDPPAAVVEQISPAGRAILRSFLALLNSTARVREVLFHQGGESVDVPTVTTIVERVRSKDRTRIDEAVGAVRLLSDRSLKHLQNTGNSCFTASHWILFVSIVFKAGIYSSTFATDLVDKCYIELQKKFLRALPPWTLQDVVDVNNFLDRAAAQPSELLAFPRELTARTMVALVVCRHRRFQDHYKHSKLFELTVKHLDNEAEVQSAYEHALALVDYLMLTASPAQITAHLYINFLHAYMARLAPNLPRHEAFLHLESCVLVNCVLIDNLDMGVFLDVSDALCAVYSAAGLHLPTDSLLSACMAFFWKVLPSLMAPWCSIKILKIIKRVAAIAAVCVPSPQVIDDLSAYHPAHEMNLHLNCLCDLNGMVVQKGLPADVDTSLKVCRWRKQYAAVLGDAFAGWAQMLKGTEIVPPIAHFLSGDIAGALINGNVLLGQLKDWEAYRPLVDLDVGMSVTMAQKLIEGCTSDQEQCPLIDELASMRVSVFDDLVVLAADKVVELACVSLSNALFIKLLLIPSIALRRLQNEFTERNADLWMRSAYSVPVIVLRRAFIVTGVTLFLQHIATDIFSLLHARFASSVLIPVLDAFLSSIPSADSFVEWLSVIKDKIGPLYVSSQNRESIIFGTFLVRVGSADIEFEYLELQCFCRRSTEAFSAFGSHPALSESRTKRMLEWAKEANCLDCCRRAMKKKRI